MRVIAVVLLALLPSSCSVLFPTDVDPCPLPPEKHPEAWQQIPILDATGAVIMYTYVCTGGR